MTGRVVDSTTGTGVEFAVLGTARPDGSHPGVEADFDGNWSFPFEPTDTIVIAHTAYRPATVLAATIPADGLIALQPRVNDGGTAVVRPSPEQRKDNTWLLLLLAAVVLDRG